MKKVSIIVPIPISVRCRMYIEHNRVRLNVRNTEVQENRREKYFQYYKKYRYKKFLLSRNIPLDFIKNIYKRNSLHY